MSLLLDPIARRALMYCILSTLAAIINESKAAVEVLNFQRSQQCPTVNTLVHPVKLSSLPQCAGVCSAKPHCNAFYLDPIARLCYLGDVRLAAATQWTAGACKSYVYSHGSTGTSGASVALFSELQMKLFYRFKKSGLVNEVAPRQFRLTASDVSVGSDGAKFKGSPSSYLALETPGFEQYLDFGRTYSFYLFIRHIMNSEYQSYHIFRSCSAPYATGNILAKRSTFLYGYSYWTHGGYERYLVESDNFLPVTTQPALLSVGCAYNKSVYQHFYFNRSIYGEFQRNYPKDPGIAADVTGFQCMRIGYYPSSSNSLNGSLYCYGMSLKILELADFRRLEDYCNAEN